MNTQFVCIVSIALYEIHPIQTYILVILDEEDEESTFEDHSQDQQNQNQAGAKDDQSLVLEEECASCQQSNSASNLLLHPNSIAVAGKASKDALDESLCGDPLMYATFVAPVHQYSTETEPSRQVRIYGI